MFLGGRMIENTAVNDVAGFSKSKDPIKRALYQLYRGMIVRCYSKRYQDKHPSYTGCTVCSEWLRFSAFLADVKHIKGYADWEQYVLRRNPGEKVRDTVVLDKDGIVEGNRQYGKERCQFITLSESTSEVNKRNAKCRSGQFSKEATSRRARNTDFSRSRVGQLKYAMSYAKPVVVEHHGATQTFPSLHACARWLGASKAGIRHAAETGVPYKKTYKIYYGTPRS